MKLKIARKSPIPIYYQIKEQLIREIADGRLKEGDMLPSEEDWAKELGISRMTLRNALIQLINEGVLHRMQGKGTFVAPLKTPVKYFESTMYSFTDIYKSQGIKVGRKVLTQEITSASWLVSKKLELAEGSAVVHIRSLRLFDGEPSSVEDSYYPAVQLSWLADVELKDRSIYDVLREKAIYPWEAMDEIELGLITEDDAALLQAPKGTAVLKGTRVAWDKDGLPLEYYHVILRGDRFKIISHSKDT
jgi:GntR family transcriptional regulator